MDDDTNESSSMAALLFSKITLADYLDKNVIWNQVYAEVHSKPVLIQI